MVVKPKWLDFEKVKFLDFSEDVENDVWDFFSPCHYSLSLCTGKTVLMNSCKQIELVVGQVA